MELATIDLGKFTLAARNAQVTLTVTSVCSVEVPREISAGVTAHDLAALVQQGDLWIHKAARLRMSLATTTNGSHASPVLGGYDEDDYLRDAVENCAVWPDLKLELKRDQTPELLTASSPTLFLSIDHTSPLKEAVLVPETVPTAQFRGISCNFAFETQQDQPAALPTRSSSQPVRKARRAATRTQSSQYMTPQPSQSQSTQTSQPDTPGINNGALGDTHLRPVALNLLDTAIHLLMGIKKLKVGWDVIQKSKVPPLLDLAPAVWNFHYLENIAKRAAYIPSIAAIRDSLAHAQSKELSDKLLEFQFVEQEDADDPREASPSFTALQDSQAEIEHSLWNILVTSSLNTKRTWRAPKIRPPEPELLKEEDLMNSGDDFNTANDINVIDFENYHYADSQEDSPADIEAAQQMETLESPEHGALRRELGSHSLDGHLERADDAIDLGDDEWEDFDNDIEAIEMQLGGYGN